MMNSHEAIVMDPTLFWDTLKRFHFMMNTKFMVPVIGGKELDLHILYSEVTKRGGYEKVVAEKKWREVGNVFCFSSTTTSASFVLRRHYLKLLYHFELLYFFQRRSPPLSSITPSQTAHSVSNTSCKNELALVEYTPKTMPFHPSPPVEGIGTIEGKFECGYLVTVKLGSEMLRGVLYHPEQVDDELDPTVPKYNNNAIVPYTGKRQVFSDRRRRRSRRRADPNYPKPNRSGYNFFFADKHYKLKSLYPNREREFTKMIGESWNNLCPEDRMVYQNISVKDKERYERELKVYKERMSQTMDDEAAASHY